MADPRLRQLTIKTNIVKRLIKEKLAYDREAEAQKTRVERLKSEGQDDHTIAKQEEVHRECLMMIPDCQRRLKKAFEELNEFVKHEEELKETKEYENATSVINEATLMLTNTN